MFMIDSEVVNITESVVRVFNFTTSFMFDVESKPK